MRDVMAQAFNELRWEPTEKRVRATLGAATVVDTTRAVLVWEPRRAVPSYAVPLEDMQAELLPAAPRAIVGVDRQVLHPGIPFGAHSSAGESFSLRAGGELRTEAAFRSADAALAGYVVLDFKAFETWYEEDERTFSHPRDPFHRVDIRQSSRAVRIALDGQTVAESKRPCMLFETGLPVRFYLSRQDIVLDLHASPKRTECPYKGEASYWSVDVGGHRHRDLAWSYEKPLLEAAAIAGLVAFFDEKVDVAVDGQPRERPRTVFSAAVIDEAGV
jgi:uncharacterized protein (DUF427 family)